MARQVQKLGARIVATLSTPSRRGDGCGLYLVVDKGGAKRSAFLFRRDGRSKEMGLGGFDSVSRAYRRGDALEKRRKLLRPGRRTARRQVGRLCHFEASRPSRLRTPPEGDPLPSVEQAGLYLDSTAQG